MRLGIAIAVAAFVVVGVCGADASHAVMRGVTNIPAQSLGAALQQLARERNLQIIYVSEVVNSLHTEGAVGSFTSEEALRRLLKGTGLVFKYLDDNTITVDTEAPPPASNAGTKPAQIIGAAAAAATTTTTDTAPLELNEITVTAQRRSEKLQNVPVAATVVTGESFAQRGSFQVEDLKKISPSLTFDQTTSSRNNSVRIRGVGTNSTSIGIEPSTSTVIDGVVLIRPGESSTALLPDLERIEVLRGPQGTLFGKNASAGLVNIVTSAPTSHFTASADALATDDQEYQGRGTVSGPLADNLAGRVALCYRNYNGNVRNVYDGRNLNADEGLGVRGKLLFTPTDDLSILLASSLERQISDCCARPLRLLDFRASSKAGVEAPYLLPVVPGSTNTRVSQNIPLRDDSESSITSLELNLDLRDYTLTSISSYQYFNIQQDIDDDQTSSGALPGGQAFKQELTSAETDHAQTQEFRITSPVWTHVDYVAGLYFFNAHVFQPFGSFRQIVAPPHTQASTLGSEVDSRNYAAFGQVNFRPFTGTTLLLGGRLTHDQAEFDYNRLDDPRLPFRGGSVAFQRRASNTDFSLKAGIEQKVSDDVFTYFTFSQGYKGPGFNVATTSLPTDPIVKPETSNAFELGTKLRLFSRMSLNIAAFDAIYHNFAVTAVDPVNNSFQLVNAGKVKTRGFEVEGEIHPVRNLTLTPGLAYVVGTIDILNTPCWDTQTAAQGCTATKSGRVQNIIGGRLPNAPRLKYDLSVAYRIELPAPLDLSLEANYDYVGNVQYLLSQDPVGKFGGYGLLGAGVTFLSKDDRYSVALFGRNLTDKFYVTSIGNQQNLPGSTFQFIPRDVSRYYGMRLSVRY
jgi:iron complex outermembrane recepter protein